MGGGGQTREHAQLAKSLGVDQLAVVVSKLDTCDFSQDRFLQIRRDLGSGLALHDCMISGNAAHQVHPAGRQRGLRLLSQ